MSRRRWNQTLPQATDLPVLMPSAAQIARSATAERVSGSFTLRLRPAHGAALLLLFLIGCGVAQAQAEPGHPSILATIWKWTPLLLGGFLLNVAISAVAMTVGTMTPVRPSPDRAVRRSSAKTA